MIIAAVVLLGLMLVVASLCLAILSSISEHLARISAVGVSAHNKLDLMLDLVRGTYNLVERADKRAEETPEEAFRRLELRR